jgi:hypothetical protein
VAASRTTTQIGALNSAVSQVISDLQEGAHLVHSELRMVCTIVEDHIKGSLGMVRTIVEDHIKGSLEREKIRDQEQQLVNQRYEDFSSKLLNILGLSDRICNHIHGNINGSNPTYLEAIHLDGNGYNNHHKLQVSTIPIQTIIVFCHSIQQTNLIPNQLQL